MKSGEQLLKFLKLFKMRNIIWKLIKMRNICLNIAIYWIREVGQRENGFTTKWCESKAYRGSKVIWPWHSRLKRTEKENTENSHGRPQGCYFFCLYSVKLKLNFEGFREFFLFFIFFLRKSVQMYRGVEYDCSSSKANRPHK